MWIILLSSIGLSHIFMSACFSRWRAPLNTRTSLHSYLNFINKPPPENNFSTILEVILFFKSHYNHLVCSILITIYVSITMSLTPVCYSFAMFVPKFRPASVSDLPVWHSLGTRCKRCHLLWKHLKRENQNNLLVLNQYR